MPEEPSKAAQSLAGAVAAQAERLRQLSAERAAEDDARERSGRKEKTVEKVQPVDDPPVDRRRGARAWELTKRKRKPKQEKAAPTPPDPRGKGRKLDVEG